MRASTSGASRRHHTRHRFYLWNDARPSCIAALSWGEREREREREREGGRERERERDRNVGVHGRQCGSMLREGKSISGKRGKIRIPDESGSRLSRSPREELQSECTQDAKCRIWRILRRVRYCESGDRIPLGISKKLSRETLWKLNDIHCVYARKHSG